MLWLRYGYSILPISSISLFFSFHLPRATTITINPIGRRALPTQTTTTTGLLVLNLARLAGSQLGPSQIYTPSTRARSTKTTPHPRTSRFSSRHPSTRSSRPTRSVPTVAPYSIGAVVLISSACWVFILATGIFFYYRRRNIGTLLSRLFFRSSVNREHVPLMPIDGPYHSLTYENDSFV